MFVMISFVLSYYLTNETMSDNCYLAYCEKSYSFVINLHTEISAASH